MTEPFHQWKFVYRRLLPIVSWMTFYQEFHPDHPRETVHWFGMCKAPGPGWELMDYERCP